MTLQSEIADDITDSIADGDPWKRAVLRTQAPGVMNVVTGAASVVPTDYECWVLLNEPPRSFQASLELTPTARPWLVGLLQDGVRPVTGSLLLIEGEPGSVETFTHGGTSRSGASFPIAGQPRDMSVGAGALWEVLA